MDPFNPAPFNPGAGLAPNLTPHVPPEIPGAVEAGDAVKHASPFSDALDIDLIMKNLVLDRPLTLFIPREILARYPGYEFRIINDVPQEIAQAHNKGFRAVSDPDAVALFVNLVAGNDKSGKAYRPVLFGRDKRVGDEVRRQRRSQLASLYAGMDPKNKELGGKYTSNVDAKDGTFLQREGAPWRIRVK